MTILKEFRSSYNLAGANLTHLKKVLNPKGKCGKLAIDASTLRDNSKKSISHTWRKDTRKKLRRFSWKENGQEHTRNL